jgi:hypothetical protein
MTCSPDTIIGALEDGHRPPQDPDDWERVYIIVNGEPCPTCGTAIGVLIGPTPMVEESAKNIQSDYNGHVPEEWDDGYDHPVYLFCDRPACRWQGVIEWADLRPDLDVWIHRDAPTWEQVRGGDGE